MGCRRRSLPAAALAALALAGCGDGAGESATTTSTATTAKPPATTAEKRGAFKARPKQQASTAPLSPPRPGSKAAAPGVPTSKQGDDSIQTWGLEASGAERAQASAIVKAYLDARASREWGRACSLLAAKPRAEQRQLAPGASCAEAMQAFTAQVPTAALAEEARIEVLSLRVGGGYAFLIYRRPDGVYASALSGEAGSWKVVSVTPEPLG